MSHDDIGDSEADLTFLEELSFLRHTFDSSAWPEVLERTWKGSSIFYGVLIDVLTEYCLTACDTFYIGYRELHRRAKAQNCKLAADRVMRIYLKCGLVRVVERGKPGVASREANGYQLILPLPPIPAELT